MKLILIMIVMITTLSAKSCKLEDIKDDVYNYGSTWCIYGKVFVIGNQGSPFTQIFKDGNYDIEPLKTIKCKCEKKINNVK